MEESLKLWLKRLKLHESTISMLLGGLVVVVIAVLLYNYFAAPTEVSEDTSGAETAEYSLELAEEEEGQLVPQGLPRQHTVAAGEHLWGISEQYYGNGYNWPDIVSANSIANPGLIEVGQELTIPKVPLRVTTAVASAQVTEDTQNPISGSSYTVVRGDTLWDISVRAYQDGYSWPQIYQANKELIGVNPGIIEIGQVLSIPR